MAGTSKSGAANSINFDDFNEVECEVESTYDDSDRDPEYVQSKSDSSDENAEVCNFFAKGGLLRYYY